VRVFWVPESRVGLLELLNAERDWIRFIAEARNALPINHERQNFRLEVRNFALEPGNRFAGPSWKHDLSDRGGPVQNFWSDMTHDMDDLMGNLVELLEEVYIRCVMDRSSRDGPIEVRIFLRDRLDENCPTKYVAQAVPRSKSTSDPDFKL
jgi:hypothetical protein